MLPLLVPALEAFAGFVAGELLEYGVKKVVKKKTNLSSLFGTQTKNLPVPVKKNLPVPVKKNNKKSKNVLIPVSKKNKSVSPVVDNLLEYSLNRMNKTPKSTDIEVSNLVPKLNGLEAKPYNDNTLLDILQTNSENLNNTLTSLVAVAGQSSITLPLLLSEVRNLTNVVSDVSEALNLGNVVSSRISQSIENLSNNGITFDTASIVRAIKENKVDLSNLENSLNIVSKAKELEAEYHEFNKKSIQFSTSDGEVIANISPREIKARKNALDYHLSNDEATLKFDDLGLNDYENSFDVSKILELFKFAGIKSDLERLQNGS